MPRPFAYPQLADQVWLRDQYETRRRSTIQIAEEVGCTHQNVTKHLHRYGITLRPAGHPPRFTRKEVDDALESATGIIIDGLRPDGLKLAERDVDLLRLAAEAVLAKLDDPDVTLDDVISRAYEDPPGEVRGWWTGWT